MFVNFLIVLGLSIAITTVIGAAYLIGCCVFDAHEDTCMKVFKIMGIAFIFTCGICSGVLGLPIWIGVVMCFVFVAVMFAMYLRLAIYVA